MRIASLVLALSASTVLVACSSGNDPADSPTNAASGAGGALQSVIATAPLTAADGSSRGEASLVANGDRVELRIAGTGMPAGVHGAHLHMTGKCEGPKFESAGAHLNPGNRKHGSENPDGSHLGDLPNLTVAADGTVTTSAGLAEMRTAAEATLFDADGTALVIHAKADDYKTDPSGDSGDRIACGVLTRSS